MAWAPSIGDILTLYNIASDVLKGCINAPEEFETVQWNVSSIMCSVETIKSVSENPNSKLNKDAGTRGGVRVHARMCQQLLKQIKVIQERYPSRPMTVSQRTSWYFKDKSKIYDKLGQLDKMVQNFSTWLSILGCVAPQDVEIQFDDTKDAQTATVNAIKKNGRSVTRSEQETLMRYAKQVSAIRSQADQRFFQSGNTKPIQPPLECWMVDIVTAKPGEESVIGKPEKQYRCQDRLQQMIVEFSESSFRLPHGASHERVKRILDLRNRRELDDEITWVYVAGRVVEYESIGADNAATQTVMVILEAREVETLGSRPVKQPDRLPSTDSLEALQQEDLRRTRPVKRPEPREAELTTYPLPLPGHARVNTALPTPSAHAKEQFLRPPQAARNMRRLSDPGERRVQGPVLANKSRDPSPTPSDNSSVNTANSTIKRVHTEGRCKWAAKCQTKRCRKKHPSMCGSEGKCRSLTCNNDHPKLPRCQDGSQCTEPYCNYSHGRRQCIYDPCMDDGCSMRHSAGQKAVPGFWAIVRVDQDL